MTMTVPNGTWGATGCSRQREQFPLLGLAGEVEVPLVGPAGDASGRYVTSLRNFGRPWAPACWPKFP
jgi:hypothetical protein